MKLSWNWLRELVRVPNDPEKVAERLTMAGLKIERVEKICGDYRLDAEITSNRPDLLSHVGVAREISACFNVPLRWSACLSTGSRNGRIPSTFSVGTTDEALCPYYSAVLLKGIEPCPTPTWIKERLELCGIRSVHFLVDATNYVLLEVGQPLHAFDHRKLTGCHISARRGVAGEKILALDGKVYELDPDDCVIADEQQAIAIGGVMGGADSAVDESTRDILLESAFFSPIAIRKTARRLKLMSESSHRFERGVDPLFVDQARLRVVELIQKTTGVGSVYRVAAAGRLKARTTRVTVSVGQINGLLGTQVPAARASAILKRLGLRVSGRSSTFRCVVPTFRPDLKASWDIAEEVGRIYGYDKIPETMPRMEATGAAVSPLLKFQEEVRSFCLACGLQEVITYSVVRQEFAEKIGLRKEKWVTIINPRNEQLTVMRPTFLVNFIEAICHNLRMGRKGIAIFEIGNRYLENGGKLPAEDRTLAVALPGELPLQWMSSGQSYTFYHLKGIFQSLLERMGIPARMEPLSDSFPFAAEQGFELRETGRQIGHCGALRRSCRQAADIDVPVFFGELSLAGALKLSRPEQFRQELSQYPAVQRDLALLVEEPILSTDLEQAIRLLGEGYVRDVRVFDVFRGGRFPANRKSVAFRIAYQSNERTLHSDEVNRIHFSIVEQLAKKFHAELPPKEHESE